MLKKIPLALISTIVFIILISQGFRFGTESSLITESIPSAVETSVLGALVYLSICVSMVIVGLAIIITEPTALQIDIFKRDSIVIQTIKPLLIGYIFGIAYISLVQLFLTIVTLWAGNK